MEGRAFLRVLLFSLTLATEVVFATFHAFWSEIAEVGFMVTFSHQ
jgi:hypothetical protein